MRLCAGPTWPGPGSLCQPLDALLQALEAWEAVIPSVGQHGLGIGEHAGQTRARDGEIRGVRGVYVDREDNYMRVLKCTITYPKR